MRPGSCLPVTSSGAARWPICSLIPHISNPCCCSSIRTRRGGGKERQPMVKVREDQPLDPKGRVDIGRWVERLEEDVKLRAPDEMRAACDIAQRLELESERPHKAWLKDGSSFRMGLEMADILGELRLDQPALE